MINLEKPYKNISEENVYTWPNPHFPFKCLLSHEKCRIFILENIPHNYIWLEKYKNPYAVTVADTKGRLGFDLGVTGAPETFVVNAQGEIVYRHIGVVNQSVWDEHMSDVFPGVDKQAQNGVSNGHAQNVH